MINIATALLMQSGDIQEKSLRTATRQMGVSSPIMNDLADGNVWSQTDINPELAPLIALAGTIKAKREAMGTKLAAEQAVADGAPKEDIPKQSGPMIAYRTRKGDIAYRKNPRYQSNATSI